jgi:hypothetical protein
MFRRYVPAQHARHLSYPFSNRTQPTPRRPLCFLEEKTTSLKFEEDDSIRRLTQANNRILSVDAIEDKTRLLVYIPR